MLDNIYSASTTNSHKSVKTKNENINSNKYAIVAGNGPSLAEIDYTRLPPPPRSCDTNNYDVFRCNQFYFEDKYYLGKNIKAATFATQTLAEQLYTTFHLNSNNEYNIESVFLPSSHVLPKAKKEFELEVLTKIFNHDSFIHRMYGGKYSHNIEAFLEYLKIQAMFFGKHPTSTILLCGIAVSMGYKEIYLAGIDFYEGKAYAFDTLQKNLLKLIPKFKQAVADEFNPNRKPSYHSKEADLDALAFLSKHYGIKFYSLCPNSPLTRYFPLAPITNNTFIPEEKPQNYTKDIMIPSAYDTERIEIAMPKNNKWNRMHNNIYFKIFSDLIRLPRDMRHYFKNLKKG